MRKIIFVGLIALLFAGCEYKANCWVDGNQIYTSGEWKKDRGVCPVPQGSQKDGLGWWKLPGKRDSIYADCECRMH
jgi:hypothetical protein